MRCQAPFFRCGLSDAAHISDPLHPRRAGLGFGSSSAPRPAVAWLTENTVLQSERSTGDRSSAPLPCSLPTADLRRRTPYLPLA